MWKLCSSGLDAFANCYILLFDFSLERKTKVLCFFKQNYENRFISFANLVLKPKCWKTERLKCQKAEKLLKNSYILTSLSCSFCHWYSLEHTEKYQMFPNGQINKQHVVLGTQSKTFPDLRSGFFNQIDWGPE